MDEPKQKKDIKKCVECSSELEELSIVTPNVLSIGFFCRNKDCKRYGLVSAL